MNTHTQRTLLDVLPPGPRQVVDPHDTVDPFPGMLEGVLNGYRLALDVVEAAQAARHSLTDFHHGCIDDCPVQAFEATLDAFEATPSGLTAETTPVS